MVQKNYWTPARAFYAESEMAKRNIRHMTFTPSYEQVKPQMELILSWHYGRQWLEERDTHQMETEKKVKKEANFIPPNYTSWLERRRLKKTRQQLLRS
ncbi:uncharacterized protein LOC6535336 [Drosophila yakuba]|uniref:Uncharacterized protein n=1 Tax=Drosophila yakuba TaxID=7245 RepID=B4PUI2_DROYA|nr:uncharacterized protein LOC6535336 [Drosophila yakuba]EDW95704.1 uncharacterized protein Dyak_GE25324 [Drosophila yakuba]